MITQDRIDEMARRIVARFEPQKIILFGSYAGGAPTEESDLDLLIITDSDLPSRVQSRKVRQLISDLAIPVDVIVKTSNEFETYKDIVGTIIYPAARFGRVIYESE